MACYHHASTTVDEATLGTAVLECFLITVCPVSPELILDRIPRACGHSVEELLCRLSEDRFIALAMETVIEVHDYAKIANEMREGFKRNLESFGLDNEGAPYVELAKRYYNMFSSFEECKALL